MAALPDVKAIPPPLSAPTRGRVIWSAARYLAGRALTILVTIFLAVLITMVIVDVPADMGSGLKMSPFQMRLEYQIERVIEISAYQGLISTDADGNPMPAEVDAIREKLRSDTGLDLPYLTRYLLWTYKALTFNWGELDPEYLSELGIKDDPQPNIILQHLPNTLLLVGTAYFLVLLIGMPFSLYLARHYGSWLDRAMTVLSPISSVPSWVFGMLLITIFAVQLRWLPVSGMFDFNKPAELIPYVLVLLKHMSYQYPRWC